MSLKGRRKPVRQTILSLFWVFVLISILISSGLISFVAYRIERSIWQERRIDAVINARDTVLSFLGNIEKLLVFSSRSLGDGTGHDLMVLELLLESDPAFYEIIQVDQTGKILNSVSRGDKVLANNFAVRQATWFTTAKQGITYLSPVEYSADGRSYVILAMSSPKGDILTARVGMSVLSQIVRDIKMGSTGRVYVVDQSGYLLAYPDAQLMQGYTNINNNPALAQAIRYSEGVWEDRYPNLQKELVLGTATRVGETGWTIFAEVEVGEAFQNSRITWIIQFIAIMIFSAITMYSSARLLDRWIFMPLQALRNGAEEIHFGNLMGRVPIFRIDEIGDVAHSFNTMAESLQERNDSLEKQSQLLREEVSAKIAAQHELERLNRELENRVQERTLEVSAANLRLQESEHQYHSLVENIPAVTYQADLLEEGPRPIFVSPQIGELLGFRPAEWLQDDCWLRQIHPDDFPTLDQFYTQMRLKADHYSLEYRLLSKGGKTVWVRDQGIIQDRRDGSRYIQGVMSDISLERESKQNLVQQALHDALTGLPNRNLLIERLGHIMLRAQRHPEIRFAVLFLDLDGFKSVNDTYGHMKGDQVLIEIGARIQAAVREFDTVARFGGDEFVILVEDPEDHTSVLAMEDRIQKEVSRPLNINGDEVCIGVSIGMACCETHFQSPDDVINAADVMMYRAKMERKNRSTPDRSVE